MASPTVVHPEACREKRQVLIAKPVDSALVDSRGREAAIPSLLTPLMEMGEIAMRIRRRGRGAD